MTRNMLSLMPKLRKSRFDIVGWCQLLLWDDQRDKSRYGEISLFRQKISMEEIAFTPRAKLMFLFETNPMTGELVRDEFRKILEEANEEASTVVTTD